MSRRQEADEALALARSGARFASGAAVVQEVLTALRARSQCWRCGGSGRDLVVGGELTGEAGTVPLFICARPCGVDLEALYRSVVGVRQ